MFTAFFLLGMLFIPFSFDLFPFQSSITSLLFGTICEWIAQILLLPVVLHDFSSDSILFWILVVILVLLSISLNLLFKTKMQQLIAVYRRQIFTILLAYLLIVTAKYGFDKLFLAQFYPPNPNLLATPLGNLDQDIALWSILGANRAFNIFMGLAELIPCILALSARTRQLALLILTGVYTNVFVVNMCFDISVKLFSLFLLLLTLFLFFQWKSRPQSNGEKQRRNIVTPAILIVLMLWEALYRHTFPSLPAALPSKSYEITSTYASGNQIKFTEHRLKKLHIHSEDYLIFQDEFDNMLSFKFDLDEKTQTIKLENQLSFSYVLDGLQLSLQNEDLIFICTMQKPKYALENQNFHWTVDYYQ